jgi:hypothetical protein
MNVRQEKKADQPRPAAVVEYIAVSRGPSLSENCFPDRLHQCYAARLVVPRSRGVIKMASCLHFIHNLWDEYHAMLVLGVVISAFSR